MSRRAMQGGRREGTYAGQLHPSGPRRSPPRPLHIRLVLLSSLLLLQLLAIGGVPRTAAAQLVQVGEGPWSWEMGGYLRSYSALADPALPALVDPTLQTPVAQHVDLLRLEHRFFLGPRVGVEVHNRLAWVQGPQDAGVGVGVTPRPDRSLNLRSVLVETDNTRIDHDVDRALMRLWLGGADVVLGRQAITWGSANLFTATDFWGPFSPFELDTSQKRGIDAARVTFSPSAQSEIELVVADRGAARDVAAGAKMHLYGAHLDGWFGSARLWEQLHVAGGLRGEAGAWTFRGEGTLPIRFEEQEADEGSATGPAGSAGGTMVSRSAGGGTSPSAGDASGFGTEAGGAAAAGMSASSTGLQPPRITLGAERFASDWIVMVEAHYNGAGARSAGDYAGQAMRPELARGETFWLGRWYAATMVSWLPDVAWTLSAGGFLNLQDPSTLLTAQVVWDFATSMEISAGWYGGFGASPRLDPQAQPLPVDLRSEFGLYGQTGFLQFAAFF